MVKKKLKKIKRRCESWQSNEMCLQVPFSILGLQPFFERGREVASKRRQTRSGVQTYYNDTALLIPALSQQQSCSRQRKGLNQISPVAAAVEGGGSTWYIKCNVRRRWWDLNATQTGFTLAAQICANVRWYSRCFSLNRVWVTPSLIFTQLCMQMNTRLCSSDGNCLLLRATKANWLESNSQLWPRRGTSPISS